MPDSSGSVDLGALSAEEQDAVDQTTPEPTPDSEEAAEAKEILFSFGVVVDTSGNPTVVQFDPPGFQSLVNPTEDLLFGALNVVLKDLQAAETAQAAAQMTVGYLQQQAAQMQQQMQEQQIAAQLAKHPMGMKR